MQPTQLHTMSFIFSLSSFFFFVSFTHTCTCFQTTKPTLIPQFTLFSALVEGFLRVKTSASMRWSSVWVVYSVEPILFHSFRPVLSLVWMAPASVAQRCSQDDETSYRRCRSAVGVLPWHCCNAPGSGSGWDSSAPWSGPPVAACNSACESCPSVTTSTWNNSHQTSCDWNNSPVHTTEFFLIIIVSCWRVLFLLRFIGDLWGDTVNLMDNFYCTVRLHGSFRITQINLCYKSPGRCINASSTI